MAKWIGAWDCRMGRHDCATIGDVAHYCHSTLSDGDVLWVTWRDAEDDVYRAFRLSGDGYSDSGFAWVDGSTWTTVYEGRTGERVKLTEVWADDDTMNYTWHRSLRGEAWEETGGGALTRVHDAASPVAAPEVARGEAPWDFMAGSWEFVGIDGGGECRLVGNAGFYCVTEGGGEEAIWVTWWDDGDEVYRTYRLYSDGYADAGVVWIDGDSWTFVYEGKIGDRAKMVTARTDDDRFEYMWHRSLRGGPWEQTTGFAMKRVR